MRATEIIRGVLDLIDQLESGAELESTLSPESAQSLLPAQDSVEEIARYKQIVDLIPPCGEITEFANTANEKYADIDAVLASGTDLLKSKNPSDIRANSLSMYPLYQHDPREE